MAAKKLADRRTQAWTATVLVAVFVLGLALALAGGGARPAAAAEGAAPRAGQVPAGPEAGTPRGEEARAAAGTPGTWERVTLVVHPDPSGQGMAVLVLARWPGQPGPGAGTAGALALPSLRLAQPSRPLPEGLRWTGEALEDASPPPPGESRDYVYAFIADTRASQGRLAVDLPAAVEQLLVMTVAGTLEASGSGLQPAGTVSGTELGMPGTDLAVWRAGPLEPGTYTILLMPAGMAAEAAGGPDRSGTGEGGGMAPGTGSQGSAPGSGRIPGQGGPAARGSAGPGGAGTGGWVGAAALVAAGAVAALALVGAARWRRSPRRWWLRRRLLIEAIVDLDRAYAAGEVPEALYREERRRLVEAAVAATRRAWAAGGPRLPGAGEAVAAEAPRGEATAR
ncbi:hypothetical protein DYI95_006330 [Thermaerobacter sp. PB12/4term]|uniref:hypothetical protein n=1 Tax=Thermaerobacter sp. PB12/4term TaxID=2293838 RepID=UPI000E329FBE|nr:hypothetical protein [Thermaerobacter sp. PB12/4term]QIA27189.1 hypothetical protein DYI95_006330 [Thermaerobacter sp. PB12/4term]